MAGRFEIDSSNVVSAYINEIGYDLPLDKFQPYRHLNPCAWSTNLEIERLGGERSREFVRFSGRPIGTRYLRCHQP